jgi:hypothetical protein
MNNELLMNNLIMTFLLIFGLYCLILLIKSMREIRGVFRDEHQVSPVQTTRAKFRPDLTTRQIEERERLLQLVRARVQTARCRNSRREGEQESKQAH